MERIFKRKLYDKLLTWKQESQGKTALLVEGARRVGKSTIVEEFAKHEYASYILIDFNKAAKKIKDLFEDLDNLDYIFLTLQANYGVNLTPRKSVIIFDEVQKCPLARQGVRKSESRCFRWITRSSAGQWTTRLQYLFCARSSTNVCH